MNARDRLVLIMYMLGVAAHREIAFKCRSYEYQVNEQCWRFCFHIKNYDDLNVLPVTRVHEPPES